MTRSNAGQRGFTLLELVIAVVLLTVGILALAKSMTTLGKQSTQARMGADLAELVDGKLEELRLIGNVTLANAAPLSVGGSTSSCVVSHCDTVMDARGFQHVRRWSVSAGPLTSTFVVTVQATPLSVAYAGLTPARSSLVILIR